MDAFHGIYSICCGESRGDNEDMCNAPEENGGRVSEPWLLQFVDEHGNINVRNGSVALIVPKCMMLAAAMLVLVLKMFA